MSAAQERIEVVVRRCLVVLFIAALCTPMHDGISAAREANLYWLHKAPAYPFSVPREYIHMFAPQTFRTMIGETVTSHGKTAVFAYKIFASFSEC